MLIPLIKLRVIVAGCLLGTVLAACGGTRPGVTDGRAGDSREIIVREITYDEKGLPLVGTPLAERPSRPGDHFTVVRLSGSRPLMSYDIAVVRQKPDFSKPFETVYEWTGKGFQVGLEATGVFAQGNFHAGYYGHMDRDEALVVTAVVFAPLTVGTVGGFVIGIADGIRQTALEMGKFVLDADEQVVTCTRYEYDLHGRLFRMRMLSPDESQELVRTEFVYQGYGPVPARSVVRSIPEGKEREVR